MRTGNDFDPRRNYGVFISVVCDGASLSEACEKHDINNRQRAGQIVTKTKHRILSTVPVNEKLSSTMANVDEMRTQKAAWRAAAKKSFKVVTKGETL